MSRLSANANEFSAMSDVCYAADDLWANAPTPSSDSTAEVCLKPLLSLWAARVTFTVYRPVG